jgi:hypothetical protein
MALSRPRGQPLTDKHKVGAPLMTVPVLEVIQLSSVFIPSSPKFDLAQVPQDVFLR